MRVLNWRLNLLTFSLARTPGEMSEMVIEAGKMGENAYKGNCHLTSQDMAQGNGKPLRETTVTRDIDIVK